MVTEQEIEAVIKDLLGRWRNGDMNSFQAIKSAYRIGRNVGLEEAISYLEDKIDGYEVVFKIAREMMTAED